MPTADSAPHVCPACSKRFGKPAKLEQHLLEAHHFELCLSPARDEPLSQALATAVAEANAAFAAAQNTASCPRCPADNRPFRNARALAQHLLIKHLESSDMTVPAKLEAVTEPSSDVSHNPRKRNGDATEKSDVKRVRISDVVQMAGAANGDDNMKQGAAGHDRTVAKEQKTDPSAVVPSPKKANAGSATTKGSAITKSPEETKAKRRSSTPGRVEGATTSGGKPPVTPKKTKAKAAAVKAGSQKGDPKAVPWLASQAVHIPAPAAITTAPMDFTGIGGFAANSRKSYYRLTNR